MNYMKNFRTEITGLVFFLFVFLFFQPPIIRAEELVSNVDGKIRVIILHYGNGSFGEGMWFEETVLFRELLDKMDRDVAFVILLGKDYKGDLAKEKLKAYAAQKLPDGTPRVKYLVADVKTSNFYPWARDGYFILTNRDHGLIFQDSGFHRDPFPIVNFPEVFADAVVRAGYIHRGGGNVRTTDQEIFVGMDTILGENLTPRWGYFQLDQTLYSIAQDIKKEGLEAFKQKFEAHCRLIHYLLAPDKKMIVPGKEIFFSKLEKEEFKFNKKVVQHTGAQAAYHTDVYLGLGDIGPDGKRVVFVADSNAGADLVEKMTPAQRRAVEAHMPEELAAEGFCAAGIPVTAAQIRQRFQWEKHQLLDLALKPSRETGKILDEAAQEMESMGYHVVRIPGLVNGLTNKEDKNDEFLGISFNYSNVLVEVEGAVKNIYLPAFGFKELDEEAAKAYRDTGFRVVTIKGLLTNALTPVEAGAGLDCMTSEIRFPVRWARKYYEAIGPQPIK